MSSAVPLSAVRDPRRGSRTRPVGCRRYEHQGNGHGRAALRLVIELTQQLQGCRRLQLTVHPDNHAARALYLSEGFEHVAVADDGELRLSIDVA